MVDVRASNERIAHAPLTPSTPIISNHAGSSTAGSSARAARNQAL